MDDKKKLAKEIITKLGTLDEKRRKWQMVWEDISDYLLPYFEFAIQKNTQARGQRTGTKIYNGFPMNAAQFFANGIQGYLVSSNMTWFRMQMEDDRLSDLPEVREWLQEIDRIFYAEFQKTNFYSAFNEFLRTGGTICTSTMYVEEDIQEGKILFNNRHPYEIFIDNDLYNQVDTVYRKFKLTARVAKQQFGEDKLPDNIKKCLEPGNEQDSEFTFIHAVEPRKDRKEWKKNSKNKKYASYYICENDEEFISESGYDMLPYLVWRPEKNQQQVYGGGPGTNALTDIIALNLISKDLLHAAELAVKPPLQAHETMRGKIRVIPDGISYFSRADEMIQPVHQVSNFPFGLDREEKIEYIIRKHFFVDFFLMLEKIEREMTATEIIERQGEKAAMLGPIIGNLNNDVLNPIFDIVFSKLVEGGKIPPPPPALQRYQGQDMLKIDYIGPLAQAQKRSLQGHGLLRGLESIAGIMQLRPEIMDILDWDQVTRELLEAHGMPQKTIRRIEEVQQIREQRAQMMQQQKALETMGAMADMASKTNKKTEEGSMLEQVQGQLEEGLEKAQ